MTIVQIGANVGNDDLYRLVAATKPEDVRLLVLVEPQRECNARLSECYEGYNHFIENCVITPEERGGEVTFFTSKCHWLSSLSREHVLKHEREREKYGGLDVVEVRVPCLTLNALLAKHDLTELDVLFIDAEGCDDRLIRSLDFDRFRVDRIYYEHAHIDREALREFLAAKGYTVASAGFPDGLCSVAIRA